MTIFNTIYRGRICSNKLSKKLFFMFQAHFARTRKRSRSQSQPAAKRMRLQSESQSRARSSSRPARDDMGIKDVVVSIPRVLFFSLSFPLSVFLNLYLNFLL